MKNKILLLFLLFNCLVGCNSHEPQTVAGGENLDDATSRNVLPNTAGANQVESTEYIEWESIRVNKLLPLNATATQATTALGQPDSVVTPEYEEECFSCHFCTSEIPPYKNVFFKGLEFEQLQDSLIFSSADFTKEKSLFLQSGNLRLDHKTKLQDIQEHFPEAVKRIRRESSGGWIRIPPAKKDSDGSFILEFDNNGYLTQFFYWFPC